MNIPNFFVIGAPKCGTTSLCSYLSEHPNIFMTKPKEPCFFNNDMTYRNYTSHNEYFDLYRNVKNYHKAIGEGSTLYLYSKNAIKNIIKLNKKSKIIIMLRNPVEMVHSWHSQLLHGEQENIKNFYKAWHLQHARIAGKYIPKKCPDKSILYYGDICKLGEQVEKIYNHFHSDQVKIIVMDDMKQYPGRIYKEVLNFLNVNEDFRDDFPVFNKNKVSRFSALKRALDSLGSLKRHVPLKNETGLLTPFHALNTRYKKRAPLSPEFRQELQEYFRDDIEKLAQIINRDLSHWHDASTH